MTLGAVSNHLNFFFFSLKSFLLCQVHGSVNRLHNVPFVVNGKVIVWCLISNITFSLVVFVSEKRLIFTNIFGSSSESDPPLPPPPDIFRVPRPVNSSKNEACILKKKKREKINAILSQVSFWKQCLIWWSYAGFLFFLCHVRAAVCIHPDPDPTLNRGIH